MSASCHITLPDSVRLNAVTQAIGILIGCKKLWEPLSKNSYHVIVHGIQAITSSCVPEMAIIRVPPSLLHKDWWTIYYHFEGENGGRSLSASSFPIACAIGKRLVDFFGGEIDCNDCDEVEIDYCNGNHNDEFNRHTKDEFFDLMQKALFGLEPITKEEVDAVREFAAYK